MSPELASRVIVLAQGHDDNRDMYAEFLRHHGFSVRAVGDGDEAFEIAPHADIIVTGIKLRGNSDGITLIEWLRADDRTKAKPIIVLSARVFAGDRARATNAGCDAFLPIPCAPDTLLREINRMLVQCVRGRPVKSELSRQTPHPKQRA